MQTKTTDTRATSKARTRAHKRKTKPYNIRKRREVGKNLPTILSNSIYSLRLKPKQSAQFAEGKSLEELRKIYSDLSQCYDSAYCIINGQRSGILPKLANNDDIKYKFSILIQEIKELIPEDADFNISTDEDDKNGSYFLTVYKSTTRYDIQWYILPIEESLNKLKKYPELERLFLQFLSLLMRRTDVQSWWHHSMGCSFEYIKDHLRDDYMYHDMDEAQREELDNTIYNYESGDPYIAQQEIELALEREPEDILHDLNSLSGTYRRNIRSFIKEGCQLLSKTSYSIYEFANNQYDNGLYEPELAFDKHFNIVWNTTDLLFQQHEEFINSEANEGIQEPNSMLVIRPNTANIDFELLDAKNNWLVSFADFICKYSPIL